MVNIYIGTDHYISLSITDNDVFVSGATITATLYDNNDEVVDTLDVEAGEDEYLITIPNDLEITETTYYLLVSIVGETTDVLKIPVVARYQKV